MKNRRHQVECVPVIDAEWETKAWGKTRTIIYDKAYSKHELLVEAGGYCSIHYHNYRANKFIIINGCVEIIEFLDGGLRRTMLKIGDVYYIQASVLHMFMVYESGVMVEEYFPGSNGVVLLDDIVRITEGGKVPVAELDVLPQRLIRR